MKAVIHCLNALFVDFRQFLARLGLWSRHANRCRGRLKGGVSDGERETQSERERLNS